jgi:hypothetical protein
MKPTGLQLSLSVVVGRTESSDTQYSEVAKLGLYDAELAVHL